MLFFFSSIQTSCLFNDIFKCVNFNLTRSRIVQSGNEKQKQLIISVMEDSPCNFKHYDCIYTFFIHQSCTFSISRIRKCMSQSNLKRIVNAFVISRIDYCNSILYGLPTAEYEKLQRVQNIAARLITGSSRRDHITPVLKNLHWLPIKSRITFKILLLTYKILNGQSPSYLTSLISSYKPVRSLRSSDHLCVRVPNVMTATYGQRTFSYCAPKLWNSLPKSLKESETVTIFKKKLKTFLFGDYVNL